jgi:hypothetical protein
MMALSIVLYHHNTKNIVPASRVLSLHSGRGITGLLLAKSIKPFAVVSDCAQIRCSLLRPVTLPCRVMSTTRDQIGISGIGIQRIMPTTGTSRRVTKRKPEKDPDTDDTPTNSNHASPTTHGTGSLVDKAV